MTHAPNIVRYLSAHFKEVRERVTTSQVAIHNTRLFPKNLGVQAYRTTGIAAKCDWSVLTDAKTGERGCYGDLKKKPRTVFLSMRGFFDAIPYFYEEVLPSINNPFVLVSGSEDITIPNQVDVRWRAFNKYERELINRIISDERLIHWYMENRDTIIPKSSTLPVGYVFKNGESNNIRVPKKVKELNKRPARMLCAHRVRQGPQWGTRRHVTNLCRDYCSDYTTILTEELSEEAFTSELKRHSFVLCVQGGGLDPSPKAWMCIANGTIPIIKASPLNDAYKELPVAVVEQWDSNCLAEENLNHWLQELGPYYHSKELRRTVLHRLSIEYWWNKICETFDRGNI